MRRALPALNSPQPPAVRLQAAGNLLRLEPHRPFRVLRIGRHRKRSPSIRSMISRRDTKRGDQCRSCSPWRPRATPTPTPPEPGFAPGLILSALSRKVGGREGKETCTPLSTRCVARPREGKAISLCRMFSQSPSGWTARTSATGSGAGPASQIFRKNARHLPRRAPEIEPPRSE